jgi:endonuclease G, mitochondrial
VRKLSKEERKKLRELIESAYPAPNKLNIFVGEELNENLALIAGGNDHSDVIFNLITMWAIPKGRIQDLIEALAKDNSDRSDIQQFCAPFLQPQWNPNSWDIDVESEELQLFLPKQFSVEADVGKLQHAAQAVCKITFVDSESRSAAGSGTGVLIAPGFVLTNYHVLSLQVGADLNQIAQSARFEFGYVSSQVGVATSTTVLTAINTEAVVAFSYIEELDYVVIQLSSHQDLALEPVPLNINTKLLPRSPLHILQHPEGEEMKVSLSNNGVVKINEEKGLVLYVNQTKDGSSGSPCFDDDWRLVALHHKSMATSFGSVREGVLFSAIHRHITKSASVVVF